MQALHDAILNLLQHDLFSRVYFYLLVPFCFLYDEKYIWVRIFSKISVETVATVSLI